jgi:hypothetical protein
MDFDPSARQPKPRERHAAQRLRERYGEDFSPELKIRIVQEIKRRLREIRDERRANRRKEKPAHTLPRRSTARRVRGHHQDRTQMWTVVLDGVTYRLVFDGIDRVIVTFLQPETRQ